jgi:hypothetical protein
MQPTRKLAAADEENPLVIRRKAPHNQRIEQTPFETDALRALLNCRIVRSINKKNSGK